jgi:hypothetical protein
VSSDQWQSQKAWPTEALTSELSWSKATETLEIHWVTVKTLHVADCL